MSVITVVTRVFPETYAEDSSNLLKPSDLGKPIEVQKYVMVDPKTGLKFSIETTFCLARTSDLSSLNVPGFVPLTNVDSALKNGGTNLGPKFALSIPQNIPFRNTPEITENNEQENSCRPSIKLHLNLKAIREATKKKNSMKKKKLVQPLLKFFANDECLICGIILNECEKKQISSHMLTHIHSGDYSCENCDQKLFPSAKALFIHSITHPGKSEYACENCNYKSNRKFFLGMHKKKKHSGILYKRPSHLVTRFMCSVCKTKVKSWKLLNHHQKTHFGEGFYTCLFCYKNFSSSCKFLRYHTHMRFKKFPKCHKCRRCQRKFFTWDSLQRHEKLHKMNLHYLCEMCGKKFNFKYSLSKHLQLHSQI